VERQKPVGEVGAPGIDQGIGERLQAEIGEASLERTSAGLAAAHASAS
jgi:hypothetical protein